ncbi:MAG: hypothetical protein B0A82_02090 [Alkalinema sp. CACIAM 70d]|nr:MAG: hypothetical protein B0A82_02090 [Alkalinema sp. CACIAM 70d]
MDFQIVQSLSHWLISPFSTASAVAAPVPQSSNTGLDQGSSLEWINHVEHFFFTQDAQPKPSSLKLSSVAVAQSDSVKTVKAETLAQPSLPQGAKPTPKANSQDPMIGGLLFKTVQGFVGNVQDLAADWNAILPPVVVVSAKDSEQLIAGVSFGELRQNLWSCAQLEKPLGKVPSNQNFYHVWVKGCRVAIFPDRTQAENFAQILSQKLQFLAHNLNQLKPILEGKDFIGKVDSQEIFRISPELAHKLGWNAELLAIDWINNLRAALGQPPLDLAQAQIDMYGLRETSRVLDGVASWYGPYFHGRITATGEVYNQYDLTVAHRDLPFDTFLKVTNRKNGKSVVVRVNDRGPYVDEHLRILDLSYRAATCLDSDETGLADIEAVILTPAPGSPLAAGQQIAKAQNTPSVQ